MRSRTKKRVDLPDPYTLHEERDTNAHASVLYYAVRGPTGVLGMASKVDAEAACRHLNAAYQLGLHLGAMAVGSKAQR